MKKFFPILNVFKNIMKISNIIDKYITAIPHLMRIKKFQAQPPPRYKQF
ncbi:hypothetical protein [Rickettsia oklahomensis]|uniref:Uncharacterized protein n=1 Tax=Rickettsia oklahomensis TaxID=3141789 RepID=A0AAU7BZ01_9RICK